MKDIKSLYLTAKSSGKPADISAYSEAIQELIKDDPNGYVTQLEYIISSSIGLDTLKPFIEQNGLPIACYEPIMDVITECIRKCEVYNKDASGYNEMVNYLENFRSKYINCFMMYENYSSEMKPNYVSTYYRKNEKGFQNNRLIAGMITHFGEGAIPDAIITADMMGEKAVRTVLEYVSGKYDQNSKIIYEWLLTVSKDISIENRPVEILEQFRANSVSAVVDNVKKREHQAFRESVILNQEDIEVEYTESDIESIRDLISFKEYQLTWADELHEATEDIQREIYSLYEMLDGVLDPEGEIEEDVLTEGVGAGIAVGLLAAPIIFIAPLFIAGMVSCKVANSKFKKRILADLSEITGKKVKSTKEYLEKAKTAFNSIFSKNKKDLINPFYKYDTYDDFYRLPDELSAYFTYNLNGDKSVGDKLLLTTDDIITGLIKESDVEALTKKLNKIDPNIKFGLSKSNDDLPGDDSGGLWSIYTRAGICEGGPEEYPGDYDDEDDDAYNKWIDKQYKAIEESGYIVCSLYLYMDAKSFIQKNFNESLSVVNTRNKKTGEIPAYLSNNHDIDYGEEDSTKKKNVTPPTEPTLDDYKRPSADDKAGSQLNLPSAFHTSDDDDNRTSGKSVSEDDKRVINNYYYTYTNSLNKNSNSFNKDNSVRDNHSVTKDDHSKTMNSHNTNTLEPEIDEDEKPEDKVGESTNPWDLNLSFESKPFVEEVGDADDNKPKSDHPIRDTLMDIDKGLMKGQQKAKKAIQDVQNAGRAAMKPLNRSKAWVNKIITDWKDADETKMKEKMADPQTRNNLFSAIRWSIKTGSLMKAGLLFNPVFMFLSISLKFGKNKRMMRIRNEMIGEIKTEMAIIDEKIKDADSKGDNAAKYKLMRFKNELNKKLIRVGGDRHMRKMI